MATKQGFFSRVHLYYDLTISGFHSITVEHGLKPDSLLWE